MSFQQRICKAFCAEVRVNQFRGGFGVSTPFADALTGDPIGFYVVGPQPGHKFKIMDDALTVARFESEGATLDSKQRMANFQEVLSIYGGSYDEDSGEIAIPDVMESELERKALDFMALLLRLQDMTQQTQERSKNVFADDVAKTLAGLAVDGLSVVAGVPVFPDNKEVIPDFVLRRSGYDKPLALFLAKDNEKLWQAMHLQMTAEYEIKKPVSIVVLLESGSTGSQKMRDKASNRISALTNWRGDEGAAINRILRELEVQPHNVH
ncbi:MAG: DUF1828 domain-containing protein [Rhodobacter sp.]|jgi:hypothetical protein|nr:DUF1828 domain-containing protein [Rhodobacter sp.]